MELNTRTRFVRIVVLGFGAIALIYGFLFMVIPGRYLNVIGASPVPLVHVRWPGGVLVALALGAWRFYRNPGRDQTYLVTITVAPLLGGLALLYSLVAGEYDGNRLFYALPGVLGVAISILLLWGQRRSRGDL